MEYQKIRYGEPFQIRRRLGDLFRDIVRIKGVSYERGKGFIVSDYYALSNLNKILIRMGLLLTPEVKCFICGAYVDCEKCTYTEVCLKDVSTCICDKCIGEENLDKNYYIKSQNYVSKYVPPTQ